MASVVRRERKHAYLDEVFLSIQGEGIWVGERQAFVRFSGCGLDCAYCDSQRARRLADTCELRMRDGRTLTYYNPVSSPTLSAMLDALAKPGELHSVAITGGEPLLQHAFLAVWLPDIRAQGYRVYLETAGTLPERLEAIIGNVDFCSMDIKLSSATSLRSYVGEHRAFLSVCRAANVPTMAKAVVSAGTTVAEVTATAQMIAETWDEVPLVIQPVTPTERMASRPSADVLLDLQDAALQHLRTVRVIPQTHRLAGLP